MVSLGTLESVEFLEVVGGDLEVPPDEEFEAEVGGPKIVGPDGERWSKLHYKLESTFKMFMHHTTNQDGFDSAYGQGKLAKHSWKVITI